MTANFIYFFTVLIFGCYTELHMTVGMMRCAILMMMRYWPIFTDYWIFNLCKHNYNCQY